MFTVPYEKARRNECYLPKSLWMRWVDKQTTETLLVRVNEHVLHVEGYHEEDESYIQVHPAHFTGTLATVRVLKEDPPIATKIVIEPLTRDLDGIPIADILSTELQHWNVLEQGTTISFDCEALGGLTVDIAIKKTYPEPLVRLRGEVPFEVKYSSQPIDEFGDYDQMVPYAMIKKANPWFPTYA